MNTAVQPFDIRQATINLNHWYVVAAAKAVGDRPVGVVLWGQAIVLFRDCQGEIQALDDRCPHRFVKLSQGRMVGDQLECAYHGWRFNDRGECVAVPYLAANQKLPSCKIRCYPVREQAGFVWIFPGEPALATAIAPLPLPEWDDLNYVASVAVIDTQVHFSFVIENLMDMYHGHLHQDWQAWTGAVLTGLEESCDRVDAYYQAQNYYRVDQIWSVLQLFLPNLRRLHPDPLDVSYVYPHWRSRLGEDFQLYCLFCPVSSTQTRAFLIHFTSLQGLHWWSKFPIGLRRWVKNRSFNVAQRLLKGLVQQDIAMMEQEQQAYWAQPQRQPYELNRALVSVQRLIRTQAEAE